jgi:hypothetical protein
MRLDKIMEAVLSYDTYESVGDYGVTSLEKPRYWFKLKQQYPNENCLPLESMIDSKIGTGFHTIAEEALRKSDIKCEVERQLSADIGGYKVGGTCDLILYDDNDVATVADWKTMKAYPAKKAFNGEEHEKFVKQLSLYAYMLRKKGAKVSDTGYIYVVVVGWTARDKDIPRIFRIDLKLMSDTEVEEYVKERIEAVDTVTEVDCPQWMCDKYCELRDVCPAYNCTGEFKDEC